MLVRSSLHVTQHTKSRKHDPGPKAERDLPVALKREDFFTFDTSEYDLCGAVIALLLRCGSDLGHFPEQQASPKGREVVQAEALQEDPPDETDQSATPGEEQTLEDVLTGEASEAECHASDAPRYHIEEFKLDDDAWQSVEKQHLLTRTLVEDEEFLGVFDRLVKEVVLPYYKRRLVAEDSFYERKTKFFYQRPPTLRLQPGPSDRFVRQHSDAVYGHQNGELNFWMPLSPYNRTRTTLWVESAAGAGDFHPLDVDHGEIAAFHGTFCRHYVPANSTRFTRVSLDFRVGVEGCFDPVWVLRGTKSDHTRLEAWL